MLSGWCSKSIEENGKYNLISVWYNKIQKRFSRCEWVEFSGPGETARLLVVQFPASHLQGVRLCSIRKNESWGKLVFIEEFFIVVKNQFVIKNFFFAMGDTLCKNK